MRARSEKWCRTLACGLFIGLSTLGCDVESSAPAAGSGVKLPNEQADAGADGEGDAGRGEADRSDAGSDARSPVRGFYVIHSDTQSASVSVLDRRGRVLSDLLISSGSENPGISTAFSGDVVPPSAPVAGDEIVLIDRGNHVLSWVELETGEVRRQIHAGGQSFAANPYDYVEYGGKAFVARFESNPQSKGDDFDEGGDLLVLDVTSSEAIGAVSLASVYEEAPETVLPRPTDVLLLGERLLVLTVGIDATFADYAESRVLVINPEKERIEQVYRLRGLRNCSSLARSPNGKRVAVACMGPWGESDDLESGVTVLDVTGDVEEVWRVMASELDGARTSSVDFVDDAQLLVVTLGDFGTNGGSYPDRLWRLDFLDEGVPSEVLAAPSPFVFSGLRCEPTLSTCLIADIETEGGVVHWLELEGGEVERHRELKIDDGVGLPPRYIGAF